MFIWHTEPPASSACVERTKPVPVSVAFTTIPGRIAPDESVTEPVMVPVSCCVYAGRASNVRKTPSAASVQKWRTEPNRTHIEIPQTLEFNVCDYITLAEFPSIEI